MSLRPQNEPEHQSKSLHKTDDYWCTPLTRQLELSDLPDRVKLIKRLKRCAQYRRNGLNSGKVKNFCNLRYLCRFCSVRDANNIAQQYAEKILDLMIRFELCPIFMTLSPRPGVDLVQQLEQVEEILGRIRQQRKNHFSHGKRFNEFCRFQSALVSLEVKRTDDGSLWFPHVHGIFLNQFPTPRFNKTKLDAEWLAISGAEKRPEVKNTTAGRLFRDWQRSGSIPDEIKDKIKRDLRRMIRYPLKPLRFCLQDLIAVHSAMRGRHRIREWPMPKIQRSIPASKV
jgi:hypothetical protein